MSGSHAYTRDGKQLLTRSVFRRAKGVLGHVAHIPRAPNARVIGRRQFGRLHDVAPEESAQPPPVGTEIELRRGSLVATGKVVWVRQSACGLRFNSPIVLERWIPNVSQQRVDNIVADVRSGGASTVEVTHSPAISESELKQRIAEELAFLTRSLEALGDELSDDLRLPPATVFDCRTWT